MKIAIFVLVVVAAIVTVLWLEQPELPAPVEAVGARAEVVRPSPEKAVIVADARAAEQPTQSERLELAKLRAREAKLREVEQQNAQLKAERDSLSQQIKQRALSSPGQIQNYEANRDYISATRHWTSSEVAAADSVEGQLRSEGKRWVQVKGEIIEGAYVQDTLEGRLNQVEGRGAIGKVVTVKADDNGKRLAIVDFGHGVSIPIFLTELSLVNVGQQ